MANDSRITSLELFEKLSTLHPMSGGFADACRENAGTVLDALRDASVLVLQVIDLRPENGKLLTKFGTELRRANDYQDSLHRLGDQAKDLYAAKAAAESALALALAERDRAREAIAWACGEVGEWPERKVGQGAFYWRSELRKRAGIPAYVYDAERKTLTAPADAGKETL